MDAPPPSYPAAVYPQPAYAYNSGPQTVVYISPSVQQPGQYGVLTAQPQNIYNPPRRNFFNSFWRDPGVGGYGWHEDRSMVIFVSVLLLGGFAIIAIIILIKMNTANF